MKKSKYSPCSNMKEIVDFAAEQFGEKDAFCWKNKKEICSKTYQELKADSENFSNVLHELGLTEKNIAVIGMTSYEWIISFFGIVNSASTAVPLDVQLPAAEACELLNRAHVSCLVYDPIRADIIAQAKKLCPDIKHYICMQKEKSDEESYAWQELMEKYKGSYVCEIDNEKLCLVMFTSGTTGKSKGVMLTHLNFADNACCFTSDINNGVALSVLPIHHAYCLTMDILKTLYEGATICINDSLMHIGKNLQTFQPTHMLLVPMILEGLYKKMRALEGKMSKEEIAHAVFGPNLKIIYSGGAYLSQEYIDNMKEYGITVLQGYGMTECSPVISSNSLNECKANSVGKLIPNCEAKTVEEEIWVKGSSVMMGYLDMPEETKETLVEDGWLRTGDLGYIDKDGFVFITGRKKNLIIMANGENISPEEIENVLGLEDLIKEIIVSGVDNGLAAEIFPDYEFASMKGIEDIPGELQKLIDIYNKDMPQYKKLTKLMIRKEEFEKTPSKKIKRKPVQV